MVKRVKAPDSTRVGTTSLEAAPTERGRARESAPPEALPSEPGYARAPSFFGLPRREPTEAVPEVDVLLSGVPYDGGSLHRSGARGAPRAVRDASVGFGSYSDALGIAIWEEIRAADGGDLVVGPSDPERALPAIARRAEAVARSGVIGGWVGGDQTVTLGVLRGIHRAKLRGVGLVHIDSATDMLGPAGALDVHQGSALRVATDEGLVRHDRVIQIGIRGPFLSERELSLSLAKGFEIVKVDEVRWDIHSAVSQVRKIVRKGSLYVSVDVSVLDPAYAPGASVVRPGGLHTWELQQLLRALVGAQIVGFDVVGFSPAHDASGATAFAAASALHELMAVIADTHRSARPAPSSAGRRRGKRLSP